MTRKCLLMMNFDSVDFRGEMLAEISAGPGEEIDCCKISPWWWRRVGANSAALCVVDYKSVGSPSIASLYMHRSPSRWRMDCSTWLLRFHVFGSIVLALYTGHWEACSLALRISFETRTRHLSECNYHKSYLELRKMLLNVQAAYIPGNTIRAVLAVSVERIPGNGTGTVPFLFLVDLCVCVCKAGWYKAGIRMFRDTSGFPRQEEGGNKKDVAK